MPAYAEELLVSGHETRLQRLESNQERAMAQTTEALTKIGFVAEKIQELGQQLDKYHSSLSDKIESVDSKLLGTSDRVHVLEDSEKVRSNFLSNCRRLALFAAVGVVSVVLTKFGESLWVWLIR